MCGKLDVVGLRYRSGKFKSLQASGSRTARRQRYKEHGHPSSCGVRMCSGTCVKSLLRTKLKSIGELSWFDLFMQIAPVNNRSILAFRIEPATAHMIHRRSCKNIPNDQPFQPAAQDGGVSNPWYQNPHKVRCKKQPNPFVQSWCASHILRRCLPTWLSEARRRRQTPIPWAMLRNRKEQDVVQIRCIRRGYVEYLPRSYPIGT